MPGMFSPPATGRFTRIAAMLLLSALALPAQAGSWQNNVAIGGFNAVHLYSPDSSSPIGNGRSLLIVLHGCTQPIGAYLTARLEDAAEAHGMVVAVPDAMNKAGFSCWSYWQGAVSRSAGDYRNLIQLAQALAGDAGRGIDPDQVYIAGLSSGATFAAQTACLAPDIFAGVATSAGPSIGTSSGGAISVCEAVSPTLFESRCRGYAGAAFQGHLDNQVAVIAHGTGDTTVNTCYNEQNANGFARVYGVNALPGSQVISDGTRSAEAFTWQDHRVTMLWLNGLGHAWSGGAGASGSFIGAQSINFASFLGERFATANRRVDRNQPPQITTLSAAASGDRLHVSGQAVDPDGSVAGVRVVIDRIDAASVGPEAIDATVAGGGTFAVVSPPLADGLYEVAAYASDDQGLDGPMVSVIERVGDPPPSLPPLLDGIAASVIGQCATISGSVVDPNQDLASVAVAFAAGSLMLATVEAEVAAAVYAATRCGLPGGEIVATVTASDATGLQAFDSIAFTIDAGQVGNVQFHIDQGHITWGSGYAQCYLAFGTSTFTMRESAVSGGQCIWTAEGAASCQGPAQACSTAPGGGPDPDPGPPSQCIQHTTMNYLHRNAGRAYSSGLFWAPDYYAEGSDEAMPGSTYGTTTLSSTNGGHWSVAPCPD